MKGAGLLEELSGEGSVCIPHVGLKPTGSLGQADHRQQEAHWEPWKKLDHSLILCHDVFNMA